MVTMSSPDLPWAFRVARLDSCEALDRLMDTWYEAIKAAGGLQNSVGFDAYMERGDWESARRSIERTYGSSSREHQNSLDTLSAAIRFRNVCGSRPTACFPPPDGGAAV